MLNPADERFRDCILQYASASPTTFLILSISVSLSACMEMKNEFLLFVLRNILKSTSITVITILDSTTSPIIPVPAMIPPLIAQKRNARSSGSLTAVLNLTIDNAPTIPRDTITLLCMVRITDAVITVVMIRDILKCSE